MSSPEESSAGGGGNPIERRFQEGALPAFEALQLFDESRQMFYDWLSAIEVEIVTIDVYSEQAGIKIVDVAEAFGETAAQIVDSFVDKTDAQDYIAWIWRDDDAQRMIKFTELTGCLCFDNGSEDYQEDDGNDEGDKVGKDNKDDDGFGVKNMVLDNIAVAFDQAEVHGIDLADAVANAYTAVATQEIGKLFGHLAYGSGQFHENDLRAAEARQEQPEQEEPEVIMELIFPAVAEKVMSYTVDVAKIAIGAGIALWVHKKFQGRA